MAFPGTEVKSTVVFGPNKLGPELWITRANFWDFYSNTG